jgi:hypothetical protein
VNLGKLKGDFHGYEVEGIVTHSIRKGSASYASSDSIENPSRATYFMLIPNKKLIKKQGASIRIAMIP